MRRADAAEGRLCGVFSAAEIKVRSVSCYYAPRQESEKQMKRTKQLDADRAIREAQIDADRTARGAKPKRHYHEEDATYRERVHAWSAQRCFAEATADQCTGETTKGVRCRLRGSMSHTQAAPLRAGGQLCAHHEPDVEVSHVTRCAGTRPDGSACKVTSVCSFAEAKPLRQGSAYCSSHLWHGWVPPAECTGVVGGCVASLGEGTDESVADSLGLEHCDACQASWRAVGGWCSSEEQAAWFQARGLIVRVRCLALNKDTGLRCKITSTTLNDGALPLRCGADKCAPHGGVVEGRPISDAELLPGLQWAARVREEHELAPARLRPVLLGSRYDAI
jgi:hypothetical protein